MYELSAELASGIAAYARTWNRFDGLRVSAQCGSDPAIRQVGRFDAGNCQPTLTTDEGRRYAIRDLGSLRVEVES
jgi:hypothetical protein